VKDRVSLLADVTNKFFGDRVTVHKLITKHLHPCCMCTSGCGFLITAIFLCKNGRNGF